MMPKLLWSNDLRVSERISNIKVASFKFLTRIKMKKSSLYLIAEANNPDDELDIMTGTSVLKGQQLGNPIRIIGVASDYEDAVELVAKIAQEVVEATGDCKLKDYFKHSFNEVG